MQPADIGRLATVADPKVSPDGRHVAFVVTRVDLERNRYRSAVWLATADGSVPPYPLTAGEHGDQQPAWSPDGRRLAFTRTREDGGGSLHVLPVGTYEFGVTHLDAPVEAHVSPEVSARRSRPAASWRYRGRPSGR